MMELLTNADAWMAFVTLTALELVLGIDNIIFISILVDRLPEKKREFGRRLGLFMAMFVRRFARCAIMVNWAHRTAIHGLAPRDLGP
jgi:predicted tellurium resistance membrane protein TerC